MASTTWTGKANSDNWNDPTNWDAGVPEEGDDITIPALHGNFPEPLVPSFTAGKLTLADLLDGGPVTVTDTFTWTDGSIFANLTLTGGGTITIPPDANFGVARGATVNIQSSVTISGGGILQVNEGASIVNNSTVTLTGGTSFQHGAGAFGSFTNNGSLIVQNLDAPSKLQGGVFTLHLVGDLTIAFGSLLLVGGGASLSLEGGQIGGPGSLIVGDGNGGILQLNQQDGRVLPGANVALATNGTLQAPNGPVQPLPSLVVDGVLRLSGGSVAGQVHVTQAGQVSFEGNPAGGISGVTLQNDGTAILQPGAELWIGGGGRIRNSGRLTINPGRMLMLFGAGGFIDNSGLMEKVGVDFTSFVSITVTNTGSIALRDGQLSLANGAVIDQTDGTIFLVGGNVVGDSKLVPQVILEGGSLTGKGSIGCILQNGGWVEPDVFSGLTVGQDYIQLDTGNLVVSPSAWNVAVLPLQVTGSATLVGGSIWVLAHTEQVPLDTPATLLTAAQLNGVVNPDCSWINGTFGCVRAPSDEQRLQLAYGFNPGSVTGKLESTPLYYGFDRKAYPVDDQTIPRTGDSLMEQLYENTPLSYVGFYLAPAPNHPDASWMGKLAVLRDQGWGVLPAYVGLQQQNEKDANGNDIKFNLIDQANINHATQQGTDNAQDALQLAGIAALEAGACIFLDIESSVRLSDNTFAYVSAWVAGVQQGGYQPALYCPVGRADELHGAQPGVPIWVSRSWFNNAVDDNCDVRPVTFDLPQGANPNQNWGFLNYAQTWQFITDWPNPLRLYHDTGNRHDWDAHGLDFNVSHAYDPSGVTNGPKGPQRRVVVNIALDQANVQSGQQTTAQVNLSNPAPQPDGTVVLFRSSAPEAIATGLSRIPAGAQSTAITIHTVPTQQQITVTLSARVLHQLGGDPVEVTLTLLPA